MDESVPVVPMQVDLPTSNPLVRNDKQDGLDKPKQVAARKDGDVPKSSGQKSVKEITKSVRKAPNSTAAKRTIDKTTKQTKITAKKVETKATRDKSPMKKKAASKSKDKKPKKLSKEAGVKKSTAKASTKARRKYSKN